MKKLIIYTIIGILLIGIVSAQTLKNGVEIAKITGKQVENTDYFEVDLSKMTDIQRQAVFPETKFPTGFINEQGNIVISYQNDKQVKNLIKYIEAQKIPTGEPTTGSPKEPPSREKTILGKVWDFIEGLFVEPKE